jgi:hypothetical protein
MHAGVILLRLDAVDLPTLTTRVDATLGGHGEELTGGSYVVVTERRIRVQ